jgi:hypothetical protein
MQFLWDYIKGRLGDAVAWKAILTFAVGIGLNLTGVQIDAIALAMVGVYNALSLLLPKQTPPTV